MVSPRGAPLLTRFQEEASHLPALTGIRGWAALWVFLFHAWLISGPRRLVVALPGFEADLTPFVSIGWAGVPIFFVLSGFLLGLPFAQWQAGARQRPALGRYLLRRVLRVFPAYYAQLFLLLVLAVWLPYPVVDLDGVSLFKHLFMLFAPPPVGAQPIVKVWWTLPVEFSFYLVLPWLALMLAPGRWTWLLVSCMATMWAWRHGMVVWLADAPVDHRVMATSQLPGSLDTFGIGLLAAHAHVHRQRFPQGLRLLLRVGVATVLSLIIVVAAIYVMHMGYRQYWSDHLIFYVWTPVFGLAVALLILTSTGGCRLATWLFANKIMVFLGVISYSLYLWHLPILTWFSFSETFAAIPSYRLPWVLLMALPLTLLAAALSYALVERPFLRLRPARGKPTAGS